MKNADILRWLSRVAGKEKWNILALTLTQVVMGVLGVSIAVILRGLVDAAVGADVPGIRKYALLFAAVVVVQLMLGFLTRFLREWTESGLENRFRARLFACLLRRDYATVTSVHTGEWMNRLTSDTQVVALNTSEILPNLAGMLVRLIGALAAIIVMQPLFAAVLIPVGLVMIGVTYFMRAGLRLRHKQVQEADGRVRVFLQERLSSLMIVRSFGMEESTEKEAAEKMGLHRSARIDRNLFSNFCNLGFGVAVQGSYAAAAIYCAVAIFRGAMSYGTFTAILELVGIVQRPMANLSGVIPRFASLFASAERLMEAEYFAEDAAGTRSKEEIRRFYQEDFIALELRRAGFTYKPPVREDENAVQSVALRDLSLKLCKGEFAALTGHSGSGKSTVLKLLMAIYPLECGSRVMQTRHGERELDASWRSLFAYVPQGNQLLSGSIREIIAFGDRQAMRDEEGLLSALRIACADEFVLALDKGLDTLLGEGGAGLSEGQMQRIAIARAVFSDRPILLLDEATSSLDAASEQRVLQNLRAMTDKTVVIVTHRPAALKYCDKQIELADS